MDGLTSLSSALTGLFAAGENFRFLDYVDLNSRKLFNLTSFSFLPGQL